jgi:tRNA (cytidine/uridine-2'-O-)-methyltransferase
MRLALFEPDIAANTAAVIRLAACFDLPLDIIEPTGFVFDPNRLRRVALDYLDRVELVRHRSLAAFERVRHAERRRLVLLTTQAPLAYTDARFGAGDVLLAGRESAGVPPEVHSLAELRVRIPIRSDCRALNVAMALAIVASEARRQLGARGAG